MTKELFIDFLDRREIPYQERDINGLELVYVFSKKEFLLKQKHPKKYKDLYVPYLRVSHFDEDRWYTRDNGWTSYMSISRILEKCKELGA